MPFVFNAWYVAAWQSEIEERPVHKQILGRHVLLFRGESGRLIALHDTCPHRFAPLHRGRIVGDTIHCGYHGLGFDAAGRCAHNPFNPKVLPSAAQIHAYPIVERDRFVWIWMGDATRADPQTIPDFHWLGESDQYTMTREGAMEQALNYELITDNLLDLSHGQFLHPTTLGNESMTGAKVSIRQEGTRLHYDRWNADGQAPTLFTISGASAPGARVDFWNDMRWDAPGAFYLEVGVTAPGQPRGNGAFFGSAHMLTPVNESRTVYRYILFRTFARGDQSISDAIDALVQKAFREEDEPMISAVQERMANREFWSLKPVLLAGDRAAVLARRTLESLIAAER